jgi:hypothetical protein
MKDIFLLITTACKIEGARFHVILVYKRISINLISFIFAIFLVCILFLMSKELQIAENVILYQAAIWNSNWPC